MLLEKTGRRLYMKYPLRLALAALLACCLLLFAADTSAQQRTIIPACGVSNPSPSPCTPRPTLLSAPSPTYSEEAIKAKIEGSVVVGLVVDEKGNPTNLRVITGLGMGLNEKALENVKIWKFEPALKDGKPFPAHIYAEVIFHL